jgi:hypothetical protein
MNEIVRVSLTDVRVVYCCCNWDNKGYWCPAYVLKHESTLMRGVDILKEGDKYGAY